MKRWASFILLTSVLISACTLYQKPNIPKLTIPCDFKINFLQTNPYLRSHWWENFNDNQLNKLVCMATHHNLNYQIAIKNIEIAQTFVDQAASALLPQVNLNYFATRNKLSQNGFNVTSGASSAFTNSTASTSSALGSNSVFNLQQLFLSVNYELDVWNQVHNSVNQAKANVIVSEAESRVIKLTLITNVVGAYFQIVTLNATIANLKQQYYYARQIARLTQDQYRAGLIDISIVVDAKNQVEVIKSSIDNLQKQREILVNSMAYLIGTYPEYLCDPIRNCLNHLNVTKLIPEGIPCRMLANRPDIQSAFFQVVSYGYLEKQMLANFLPVFNLTGNLGFSSTSLANFISKGSLFWNYGVNILQPIFDYGLRMSEYRRSRLQFEAAFLNYKNTVLNAFNEVDSALSSYKEDYNALHAFQNQVNNMKEKVDLADAQYHAGLTDYMTNLTIKLSYLQLCYNLTNQRLVVTQDIIQVYKTLGLGLC